MYSTKHPLGNDPTVANLGMLLGDTSDILAETILVDSRVCPIGQCAHTSGNLDEVAGDGSLAIVPGPHLVPGLDKTGCVSRRKHRFPTSNRRDGSGRAGNGARAPVLSAGFEALSQQNAPF